MSLFLSAVFGIQALYCSHSVLTNTVHQLQSWGKYCVNSSQHTLQPWKFLPPFELDKQPVDALAICVLI